jgi:hypothetical protein
MTGNPTTLLDPAQLPVDPTTCKPVYPHQYLKVNTIFEVARAAGLRTAWSDKHPAYEVLSGPSGMGIQDLFTPEINSEAPTPGSPNDWTTDNALTMQFDSYKVHAILNEIDGLDHSGGNKAGTPAIFGMNFQTVSTAEKLPTSDGLTGGYLAGGTTPGALLARSLDYVDAQIGSMVAEIKARGLQRSTVIILSGKHGQSPQDPADLTRIPDGPILDALKCSLDRSPPREWRPRRIRHRRRRDAHVAERPVVRGHVVREDVPSRPLRYRQRRLRQPEAVHELGAREGVGGCRRGSVLRRARERPACA